MSKKVLGIEEQIGRLKSKKITFKNLLQEEQCEDFLLKYNYLNVASLKYLFATGKGKINHVYMFETPYSTLKKNYKKILKLENKLTEAILLYETEFKVHLTLFFLSFLENEKIDFETLLSKLEGHNRKTNKLTSGTDSFYISFEKIWKEGIKNFSGHTEFLNDYHLLIKILSLGTISLLLDYNYMDSDGKKEILFSKFTNYNKKFKFVKTIEELKTIVILRNSLCHKESIVTFLDKAWRLNYKQGQKRKRDYVKERQETIKFIYEYGCKKKINLNSVILNFNQYRLKNKGIKNFKEIVIE
jgi:hypothetical protein